MSTENGRDIQKALILYVANFVRIGSGEKFNPHVTIGVATIPYLKKMLAEPFEAFTFSRELRFTNLALLVPLARNWRLWR